MSQPDWLKDSTCGCDKMIDPDPDIAGIGILSAFITTSVLTLISSTLLFIMQLEVSGNLLDRLSARCLKRIWKWPFRRSPIFKSTLMAGVKSFGDTQVVTGLCILITALIRLKSGITVYHFSIAMDLAWIADATQAMVQYVIAIEGGYRDAKISKRIRVISLLVHIGLLTFASVIQGNVYWNDWYTCQAGCFLPISHIKFGALGLQWFIVNVIFIIWSLAGIARLLRCTRLVTRQFISFRNFFLQKMGIEESTAQFNPFGALYSRVCSYWEDFSELGSCNPNPLHYAKNFIRVSFKILTAVLFLLVWSFFIFIDSILLDTLTQFAWFGVNVYSLVSDRNWGAQYFEDQGMPNVENSWSFWQLLPNFILVLPFLAAIATYEDMKLEKSQDGWVTALTRGHGDGEDGNSVVSLLGSKPQFR